MTLPLPDTIDILICGGGTAGAALAGIIARDTDLEVVLLEAGPDYGPLAAGRWPADVLNAGEICRSHQWGYYGAAHATHTEPTGYDRAKVIGGCSAHNGCVALSGHRADYDAWPALGAPGWDWESVAPAFERAKRQLRVRHVEDDEITPWQRIFVDACVAHGIPWTDDLDDPDEPVGVGASPVNIVEGMRWNTALAYLDPVRDRPNLHIVDDCLVDRVVIQDGRAVAVEALIDDEPVQLSAGRIVLAAGAYGSPAILLRSGIGPAAEIERHGISVTHPLEGVGKALVDHPAVNLRLDPSDPLQVKMADARSRGWLPDEQTLVKARSGRCTEAFDLHLYAVSSRSLSTGIWGYMICVACVEPWSQGTVTLASANPKAPPVIDHGFLIDPDGHDLDVLADGVDLAAALLATTPFTEAFGPALESLSREDVAAFVRGSVGIYYHPAGSCRMGSADDPATVVGTDGRVHGLDGLFVCDASIFPRIMRANTNLPAAMLAEHLAATIAG